MSKLIRRIIKESIDEFDWVDLNLNLKNLYGQRLFDTIDNLFKVTNNRYRIEKVNETKDIEINDNTGTYYNYKLTDFTIEQLRTDFKDTFDRPTERLSPEVRQEYRDLAIALEPIIGPMDYY